jgi:hypothetical protein
MAVDYAISADLAGQHVQRQHRQGHDEHQDPRKQPLSCFLPIHKKSSFFCLYGAKKGETICIWQPAAVRRERRLDPWLCDTGFRLLCLFLYSCFSASRTDICVCQYFMFAVYQICPKTQEDFQKYIRY